MAPYFFRCVIHVRTCGYFFLNTAMQEEDVLFYLKNIFPFSLVERMRKMNMPIEECSRELAFSKQGYDKHIYIVNDLKHVQTSEEFYQKIVIQKPGQIHFDRLVLRQCTQREIVFDLDLSDFTRHCGCGELSKACSMCWLHIEGAAFILRHLLVDRLAIKECHLLWVLSGKKGIHCLVNDPRFLRFEKQQLTNLYHLFYKKTLGDMQSFAATLSPSVMNELRALFRDRCVVKRNLLLLESFKKHVLQLIKKEYPSLHNALSIKWFQSRESSLERWMILEKLETNQGFSVLPSDLIIVSTYYPMIDSGPLGVGKKHNFKVPYSIHATTHKIALPVSLKTLLRDDLPSNTISLKNVVDYCYDNPDQPMHPELVASFDLFSQWLSHYDSHVS